MKWSQGLLVSQLLFVLLLIACGKSRDKPIVSDTAEATHLPDNQMTEATAIRASPTPTAEPKPPAASALLESAFEALESAESYRLIIDMTMITSYQGQSLERKVHSDILYQGQDRRHCLTTIEVAGQSEVQEQIIIGDAVYRKGSGQEGWTVDIKPRAGLDAGSTTALSRDVEELVLVGPEILEGRPVYHLQAKKTDVDALFGALFPAELVAGIARQGGSIDVAADLRLDYWIGVDDGRLVKDRLAGTLVMSISDLPGIDRPVEMALEVANEAVFLAYDQAVQIDAPEIPDAGEDADTEIDL